MKNIIFLIIIFILCNLTSVFSQKISKKQKNKISNLETKIEKAVGEEKYKLIDELAEIYLDIDPNKTIEIINKTIKSAKRNEITTELKADFSNSLGAAYFYKNDYGNAAKYYNEELELIKKKGDKKKISEANYNVGFLYLKSGNERKAKKCFEESLELAKSLENIDLMMTNYKALYQVYDSKDDYKEALSFFQKYISLKDSKLDLETKKKISILRRKYKVEQKMRKEKENEIEVKDSLIDIQDSTITTISENNQNLIKDTLLKAAIIDTLTIENQLKQAKISLQQAELKTTRRTISLISIISLIILIASIWLYKLYHALRSKNKILKTQKEEIHIQALELEEKNTQIIDSMNYAKRIQSSILIPESEIQKYLPNMFIFFQPREIVSGDFYWFSKVESKYIIAAIDCTGHGVPGAFLSMIGNTLLHQIVNEQKITKPDEILTLLHYSVANALQQNNPESDNEDGMDMSLCTIDVRQNRFQFAGAKNHLYVLQNDQLKVLKANYYSIGSRPLRPGSHVEFTSYDFMYDEHTSIYMLSDGYQDQFGGTEDTKFSAQRFKQMLIENKDLPMIQQKEIFKNTLHEWKGNNQQIDDILIVGVKLCNLN